MSYMNEDFSYMSRNFGQALIVKMAAPMVTCTSSCGLLRNNAKSAQTVNFFVDKHLLALEHPGEGLLEESHGAAQRLWKV